MPADDDGCRRKLPCIQKLERLNITCENVELRSNCLTNELRIFRGIRGESKRNLTVGNANLNQLQQGLLLDRL
jgi:hypothetical protein